MSELNDLDELNSIKAAPPPLLGNRARATARDDIPEGSGESDETKVVPKMWAAFGKTYSACERAVQELPSGQFMIEYSDDRGIYFMEKETSMDELMILPDTSSDEVVKGIQHFWSREQKYRDYGFLWKRGILLFGPPGSGKTSTVQLIVGEIVKLGGIAVYVNQPRLVTRGLNTLRAIEPKRPVLVIMEDIDAIIDNHGESDILSLLDGESQIDNAVFLATTNYPEKLDKRIINRPSRFDIVRKIGMPSPEARKYYLAKKNPRLAKDEALMKQWVNDTKDYSVAHIKELIASVECLELPYDQVIARLNKMMGGRPSSTDSDNGFGFLK